MWGGGFSYATDTARAEGAAYDPATDRLRPVPDAPVPLRWWHSAVWTGEEMIVWGGSDDYEAEGTRGCPSSFVDAGAAYDPESNRWRLLPPAPIEGRMLHEEVWTGEEMIVWGGSNGDCAANSPIAGAAYDPERDKWRTIRDAPMSGRGYFDAVWTGTEMILWGGSIAGRGVPLDDGAAYDPRANAWRTLPAAPIQARDYPALAWTGREVVVWGGCCRQRGGYFRNGAVYHP